MITKPRVLVLSLLIATTSTLPSEAPQSPRHHPTEWAEVHTLNTKTCGILSIQGRRPTMEDATIVTEVDGKKFYGVFDGHGGESASAFVADHIAEKLTEALKSEPSLPDALVNTYIETEVAYQDSETPDSGTTAVTALVDGTTLYVANAGDSRAVLCENGKAVALSTDHKPNRPDEVARIEGCGGFVFTYLTPIGEISRVNGILSTSRSIGDFPLKLMVSAVPDVTTYELTDESEFLILACDGLWDTITTEEAVQIARAHLAVSASPRDAARALVAEAFSRQDTISWENNIGIWDNTTVMVVVLNDDHHSTESTIAS